MAINSIVLPQEYPLVLLAGATLCLECFIISFVAGMSRKKYFTKEHMQQFEKEHEAAFPGSKPSVGGWPDSGDGRYSAALPYKDWVEFNNRVRVHMNFVEMLPITLLFLCVGGLVLPKAAMYIGFIVAVARLVYTIMYVGFGANSRLIGAIGGSLPLYGLSLAAFV